MRVQKALFANALLQIFAFFGKMFLTKLEPFENLILTTNVIKFVDCGLHGLDIKWKGGAFFKIDKLGLFNLKINPQI